MTRRPILLLAETGFIIRNLLLGTFSDAIMEHRPLVVAVPDPNNEQLQDLVCGKPLKLISFLHRPLRNSLSRIQKLSSLHSYMYRFKQAEKATKSLEIQTRLWESRHSLVGKVGIRALIRMGGLLKQAGLMGFIEDHYLNAIARWPITSQWTQVLANHRPAVVVSTMLTHAGMHDPNLDLPVIVAAHRLGIPCGTLVQSWDNLSSKTSVLPPWLDRYWTWSETMSGELLRLNPRIQTERVQVVGSPQFDFHFRLDLVESRENYLKRIGLDPKRPFVVIGTGTKVWLPNEPHTVMQIVESLCNDVPGCQALIRLHPKDDGSRWMAHRDRLNTLGAVIQQTAPTMHMDLGGFVPPKEFYGEQINSLTHAAIVINTASTLTVDAAILNRPVVCIGFDAVSDPKFPEGRAWAYSQSSHYGALVATGGVTVVRSLAECVETVKNYLNNPSLGNTGRREIVNMIIGLADGRAGERLAEEVLALANILMVFGNAVR
jgi:hypothetical protein